MTKNLVIARVLPFLKDSNEENNQKLINFKIEKVLNINKMNDNFDYNLINNSINNNIKPKRKRQRLDHLSEEEKLKRRFDSFFKLLLTERNFEHIFDFKYSFINY
jgi:hypothetical protein